MKTVGDVLNTMGSSDFTLNATLSDNSYSSHQYVRLAGRYGRKGIREGRPERR